MLTHAQIWAAIDALAKRYGYSPSGLARKAGLDATSFNKSKRVSIQGRERWPSTESVAKILRATGADFDEFARLVEPNNQRRSTPIDLIRLDKIREQKALDREHLAAGGSLEEFDVMDFGDDEVIALEINDNSLAPLYREDDVLIISPSATTRKGDRLLILTVDGKLLPCELKRRTTRTLEVRLLLNNAEHVFNRSDIYWDARIMWAGQ
jgi:phage repressor protein C with HTH and peptisase S24 domain